MRTFILRARKASTRLEQFKASLGSKDHVEVIAHTIANAFFFSNGFRQEVEVYVVLDSSADFPRTVKLSGYQGLSLAGFHERAVLEVIEKALRDSPHLQKDQTQIIAPGVEISGFGFEKLVNELMKTRPIYLLDHKGQDIRAQSLKPDPVFVLSDHLAMPKNSLKSLVNRGAKLLSLGKKVLFASQCVILIHHELDRNE